MSDAYRPTDPEDVLLLAADAARIVLESGGETYRAEETAVALSSSLGGEEAECFATPTGIVLSFTGLDGRVHSIVRRVSRRTMNLERVARIDDLSRRLQSGKVDFDGAASELDAIERLAGRSAIVSAAGAAAGAAFFTLFFGGAWNDALVAAFVGALLSRFTLLFARRAIPEFVANLVGGAGATFLCLVARYLGLATSADGTIIGVIMLLVPGVAITNAIRDTIGGDLVAGVARGADSFMSAAAISIGAGGAYQLWTLISGRIG